MCFVDAPNRSATTLWDWPTFQGQRSQIGQNILGQPGWHKSSPLYTETCDLVSAEPLAHPDRTAKSRSPWPTLLGLLGHHKILIFALSPQLADLRSTNLDRVCTWHGCNKSLELDLLFEVTGVKLDKSNFGTNRVAQIVTAVHRCL